MISHLYRFRSIEALLDKNELENQEIYFCPTEELNDPVEGFKDVLWRGDAIVWRNLLKHYVLCLLNIAPACFVGGADFDKNILRNVVTGVPTALPDTPIRMIYEKVAKEFLDDPLARQFVDLMAARAAPIRRYELTFYLRNLHPIALHAALKEFATFGLVMNPTFMAGRGPEEFRRYVSQAMDGAARFPDYPTATEWSVEAFFSFSDSLISQMSLIDDYQNDGITMHPMALVTHYFPSHYVWALDRLIHPDLYVACFSANATNASMWGQYGRGHRGVCLKFRMTPSSRGNPSVPIKSGVGASVAMVRDFVSSECLKVEYTPNFPNIDFFTSLGALSQEKLSHFWYKGEADGDYSACAKEALKDQAARDKYWKAFEVGALCKTPDWKHEEEYRILLHSGFPLEPSQRKLEYRFEDLSAIVFGARTDLEDKLRIMRIIDQKCAKTRRSDFEFFEICFMPGTSTFIERKLGLVRIKCPS